MAFSHHLCFFPNEICENNLLIILIVFKINKMLAFEISLSHTKESVILFHWSHGNLSFFSSKKKMSLNNKFNLSHFSFRKKTANEMQAYPSKKLYI